MGGELKYCSGSVQVHGEQLWALVFSGGGTSVDLYGVVSAEQVFFLFLLLLLRVFRLLFVSFYFSYFFAYFAPPILFLVFFSYSPTFHFPLWVPLFYHCDHFHCFYSILCYSLHFRCCLSHFSFSPSTNIAIIGNDIDDYYNQSRTGNEVHVNNNNVNNVLYHIVNIVYHLKSDELGIITNSL